MRGLLLDFGGVLVDETIQPVRIAEALRDAFSAAGVPPPSTVDSDLRAGLVAYGHWREATVRPPAPVELSHREFWTEFVAADWPVDARTVVAERASALCYELIRFDPRTPLRQGIRELLDEFAGPVGIVSNTMCGAAHRDHLAAVGLGDRFAVQLYSDEAGIRKPNPELIRRAAKAIGAVPEECWYVGDTWSRDVRCGLRAGVGTTVLMRSSRTGTETAPPGLDADLVVADPVELRTALVR
jgi:N-acetyl-D-muramate 6-phosphate phosphatase